MNTGDLQHLREREKELNCIYRVIQILRKEELSTEDVLRHVVQEVPQGWRFPGICMASIVFEENRYTTPRFHPTQWFQRAEIVVDEHISGEVQVYYTRNITGNEGPLFLPEEQHLLNTLAGQLSNFIFNRELRHTLEYLDKKDKSQVPERFLPVSSDKHWKWRYKMARLIARQMNFESMAVEAIYLIGSTKDAKAGPASDLDLLVVCSGDNRQRELLKYWIDGWSRSLAETNYQMTGYRLEEGIIDLHLITPQEIRSKNNSFAAMIGSLENSARLLRQKKP